MVIQDAIIFAGIGAATGLIAHFVFRIKVLGRSGAIALCAAGGLAGGFFFEIMLSLLKSVAPALAAFAGGVFALLAGTDLRKARLSGKGKGKSA